MNNPIRVNFLGTYKEEGLPEFTPPFLSDEEYARAQSALPIVCTDLIIVDDKGRFVLAYRLHPAAQGWWWKGGRMKTGDTPLASLTRLMQREIGFVPDGIRYFAHLHHLWAKRKESPQDTGKHDVIFLHSVVLDEKSIANIKLDPNEYDTERGLMRYDGTQEVREIVADAYRLYHSVTLS